MGVISRAIGFLKRVFSDISEKNVTFMAAGLAYNAFISLAPMLFLLFLVLTAIGGGLEQRIVEAVGNWLPGPIADVVTGLLQGEASVGGASFIGLVVLLWGTLKIFRGLDTAFSEIYETEGSNSFTDKMTDGFVVLVALVVAVVAAVGASAIFALFSDVIPYAGVLTSLALFAGLVLAFLPIYYVFPDTDLGVKDVIPGVLFAAVGWAALQGLFQVYLTFQNPGAGSFFGGVIIVVTYLYFSGLILLVGAVINAVIGEHSTGRPGGVGRGSMNFDTVRDESMNRDELADYLRVLREDLTGRYVEMRPTTDDSPERPPPNGDIEVTEHRSRKGRPRKWTVTLEWKAVEEPEDEDESDSDQGSNDRRESDDRRDSGG